MASPFLHKIHNHKSAVVGGVMRNEHMKLVEYLSAVKKRPGMYMADGTCLKDLEYQIGGYEAALRQHEIDNDVLGFNPGLREYILKKLQWSSCRGWADAIIQNTSSAEEAVTKFFELANQYLEEQYGITNAIN